MDEIIKYFSLTIFLFKYIKYLNTKVIHESFILSHNNNNSSCSFPFCFFPPVFTNSERTCDKDFIIRRAATNRVLNVLRHWVSKHSQVCLHPPLSVCVCVYVWSSVSAGMIESAVSLKQVSAPLLLLEHVNSHMHTDSH